MKKSNLLEFWNTAKRTKIFWITFLARFSIFFYVLSTAYIDTAITAMLYATSTIWFISLRQYWNKDTIESAQKFKKQSYFFMFLAIIAIGFVNVSDDGTIGQFLNFGIAIAIIAAILNGFNWAGSHKFGEDISKKIPITGISGNSKELVPNLLAVSIMSLAVGAIYSFISLGYAISTKDTSNINLNLLWVIPYSLILHPINVIYRRIANIGKAPLEFNSVIYLSPVLSVAWLLILSGIDEQYNLNINRLDLFAIGAVGIGAINIILNSTKQKFGLNWLVISLWIFGIVVYLRDGWFGNWQNYNWLWGKSGEYFAFLGLSTTVFVLILSFRSLRIIDRTKKEETIIFSLYAKIIEYSGKEEQALDSLADIAEATSEEKINFARERLLFWSKNTFVSTKEKIKIRTEIDTLTHSKSRDMDIIEPLVLIMFSILTISLTLATRPNFITEYSKYVVDMFAILFSSVIAFLCLVLFDLRMNRSITRIRDNLKYDRCSIDTKQSDLHDMNRRTKKNFFAKFTDAWMRNWIHVWMPIVLCAIMITTYGFLLTGKWFGTWEWSCEIFSIKQMPSHCG